MTIDHPNLINFFVYRPTLTAVFIFGILLTDKQKRNKPIQIHNLLGARIRHCSVGLAWSTSTIYVGYSRSAK